MEIRTVKHGWVHSVKTIDGIETRERWPARRCPCGGELCAHPSLDIAVCMKCREQHDGALLMARPVARPEAS